MHFIEFFVMITSWGKIEIRFSFFLFTEKETWNWHIKIVGGNSYCHDYCLLYLIWTGNNVMRPLGYHPPHLVNNADSHYLGNQPWQQAVLFFICIYFFCVHQFAYVSVTLWICGSLSYPSQVSKNSLLWGCQWPLKQKMIKTGRLTLGEWGCPLDNDSKLVTGQPNGR